jgi:flagella basal body P-ring formation protein FlgA
MTLVASVLILWAAGDTVVLKEEVRLSGRYIRLSDLLDADRTGDAVRGQIGEIYLGRAPEEGQSRTVTLVEIRRELERRGIDPEGFTFVGQQVVITRGGEPALEGLKRSIAFEIKRFVLEQNPGGRADEMVIRVLSLHPDRPPAEAEVGEVRAKAASEYTVVLVDPAGTKTEVGVVARILRTREVAFAVREINPGKPLERSDFELRRVEIADDESASGDLSILVGAVTWVRIRKGQKLSLADLRLKPVVRRGDVVRVVSTTFEVDARALEDGAPGQVIPLEFVTTKNHVRAKVADSGRVEVVEGGR